MAKIIYAVAIDADGHVYHKNYKGDPSVEKDVIKHNVVLFDHIRDRAEVLRKEGNEVEIRIFIFSRRQSKDVDLNMQFRHNTDSFFSDIQKISAHLNAYLEKILLADVYGGLPYGQSFEKALSDEFGQSLEHASWCDDRSKLTILYSHLHKLALENHDAKIYYDAFDDEHEILNELLKFSTKYPDMFPQNAIVTLKHYAGDGVDTSRSPIRGTGIIDANFCKTILAMTEICLEKLGKFQKSGDIGDVSIDTCQIDPGLLERQVHKPLDKHKMISFAGMFRPAEPKPSRSISVGSNLNLVPLIKEDDVWWNELRTSSAPPF